MNRRKFLGGLAVGGTTLGAGSRMASAQEDDSDDEAGSPADLTSDAFPSDVTVAWITDRFVQVESEAAPVVGHRLNTTALVLETVQSREEHEALRDQFTWDDLDYTDADAFADLFTGVAWPLGEVLSSQFFETYDLVWLVGVHDDYYHTALGMESRETRVSSDQQFYNLYGHAPLLFAAVESRRQPEPGSVVELSAVVRHATDSSGPIQDGDGGYLVVESYDVRDSLRTSDGNWQRGGTAEFAGLQHHPRPRLSSTLTEVEYDDNLPRPKGGSLLRKQGTISVADDTSPGVPQVAHHEVESESQEMLVGETLSETWDEGDDERREREANISLVIDTSGSMEERDTGWTDGGTERSRLEAAQESLRMLLDFLEDGHTVTLTEFDTNGSVVAGTTLVNDSNREALRADIDTLSHDGRTSIGGGMRTGMETISDQNGPKTMLLLSDGEENESPPVSSVLPELQNQGIEVYTIGIGSGIDQNQIERIGTQTGAASLTSPDPGEVRDFFHLLSGETQSRPTLSERQETVTEGETVEDSCRVDASCEDVQFSMSYEGSDMSLTVIDPNGNEVTEAAGVNYRAGDAHEVWTVENPSTGEWTYEVDVLQADNPQNMTLLSNAQSTVDGELFVSGDLYEQTGYVRFQLKVEDELARYAGADAHLEVIPPGGSEADATEIPLHDDGAGADDVSDDGIYSNYYHPTRPGEYEFRSVVEGGEFSDLRREFRHTAEIQTVVDDPIRPYQESDRASFGGTMLAIVGGLLLAVWLYFRRGSDEGETEEPDPDDPWA